MTTPPSETAAGLSVLLVEDNRGDARLIREMLREAGSVAVELDHVERLAQALDLLPGGAFDSVLLDLSLPDSQGLETFKRVRARAPDLAIVILSGLDDETVAVRAVQAGAQDYLVKGHVDGHALIRSLRYAVERKRLERDRRDLERQRDELFAGVSHDLRTPIAAIKASIEVVLANEPPDLSPALHRLLVNVGLAADELARLVDDLLELTRLEAGRVVLRRTRCDLRALVERAARAIEPLVEQRGQRLDLDLPNQPVLSWVDADRLGRALANLLGNAHKYGRDGGTIRLTLDQRADQDRLAVADDGPGIPAGEHEHIFERFYRSMAWLQPTISV